MKVLIAPLNWGLGHATRCIPIIESHIEKGHKVYIASSGRSMAFLCSKFPKLNRIELPDYDIKYHRYLPVWLSVLFQSVKILSKIKKEYSLIEKLQNTEKFDLIISDNRYGVYSKQTKSVFICHQLNPISPFGITQVIVEYVHRSLCKDFTEIWVPDYEQRSMKLSGKLSELKLKWKQEVKFIFPLSQLELQHKSTSEVAVLVLLSGLEPNRTIVEQVLLKILKDVNYPIVFVGGTPLERNINNISYHSFLNKKELEKEINRASIIICRSGYSTVMDLHKEAHKHLIFIPTPGQTEQEYLAKYLSNKFDNTLEIKEKHLEKKLLQLIENISNNC